MTVDILFMAKNKLVLRVNMCFSNLHSKTFCELPIEDQKKRIFDFDANDQTFSEQGQRAYQKSLARMCSSWLYFRRL